MILCFCAKIRAEAVTWELISEIYKWVLHCRVYKNKSNFQINLNSVFLFKICCNSYITVCVSILITH